MKAGRLGVSDWDTHNPISTLNLIASKRAIEKAERQLIGQEDDDWRLRVAQLREAREEERCEIARERMARPEVRAACAAGLKKAWQDGKFLTRKQGYAKRTDALVARAKRLRGDGRTYQEIGDSLNVTAYTAAKWCGWVRKPEPTNRHPVKVGDIVYPSLRAAERATGIARCTLARRFYRCA